MLTNINDSFIAYRAQLTTKSVFLPYLLIIILTLLGLCLFYFPYPTITTTYGIIKASGDTYYFQIPKSNLNVLKQTLVINHQVYAYQIKTINNDTIDLKIDIDYQGNDILIITFEDWTTLASKIIERKEND